jgi:hypothetical protein
MVSMATRTTPERAMTAGRLCLHACRSFGPSTAACWTEATVSIYGPGRRRPCRPRTRAPDAGRSATGSSAWLPAAWPPRRSARRRALAFVERRFQHPVDVIALPVALPAELEHGCTVCALIVPAAPACDDSAPGTAPGAAATAISRLALARLFGRPLTACNASGSGRRPRGTRHPPKKVFRKIAVS